MKNLNDVTKTKETTKMLIHDKYRGINRQKVAEVVSEAYKLSAEQKKLLKLYAEFDSWTIVTPATVKLRANLNDMTSPRDGLEQHGLIKVYDDAILIDWYVLDLIAYGWTRHHVKLSPEY